MNVRYRQKTFYDSNRVLFTLIGAVLALIVCMTCRTDIYAREDNHLHDNGPVGVSVDPDGASEGYLAQLYDNTNGLPTSEANDIAETSEGFIWIGSYSGLIRYDGNTFERFNSTSGITSVKCLHVDEKDRLWIGTNDSGVALLERGKLTFYGEDAGLPASSVRAIVEDSKGVIYIGTTGGISTIDTDLNLRRLDDPSVSDAFVTELRVTDDGYVFGLTNPGDLFVLKDQEAVEYYTADEIGLATLSAIFPDPKDSSKIYYEAGDGFVYHAKWSSAGIQVIDETDIAPMSQVQKFEYIDNKIWVCARNGIGVLDDDGFHVLEDLPMQNSIGHIMTDYEGNLWFTSTRQGVMKIAPNKFTDISKKYDLPSMVVNSTCMAGNKLFIGTDGGLVVLDENGIVESMPLTVAQTISGVDLESDDLISMLDGVRIRSIISDSNGNVWISTWRDYGLIKYDGKNIKAFTAEDGLYSDNVRAIYECEDGRILVANTGGVCVIKNDRIIRTYAEEEGIENTEILCVTEGENGDIICGTDGGGIYILGSSSVRHIGRRDGLTSEAVMRIKYNEEKEIYWVITGSSIAYLDCDYNLKTIDQFPYSNNFDLYENSREEVWILSSNGIYVSPVDELLKNDGLRPIHYGMSNGMPCIATANSYSSLTKEGDLYIAGATGVTKVNIETVYDDYSDLKMAVPYVDADGEQIYPDANGNFNLPSDVLKLTIYSYVFNYSLTDPIVLYKLEGFDADYVAEKRSDLDAVGYTNLPGGSYRFIMKLIDPMTMNTKSISIRIVKEKAFYEYVSFFVLLAVVILGLIGLFTWLYVRRKVRLIEAKNREEAEKERIKTELDTASRIQASMLPSEFPAFPDIKEIDLYATMEPAREVGGDFYDFYLIDPDHLCLVIADVSGKGVPASLFMMISQTIVKSIAMLGKSPAEILEKTNDALCSNNKMDMFVTVWLGVLEISTGRIVTANAGHEYPAIKRSGSQFELMVDKHGFVLGGMEGAKYKEQEFTLSPGDRIFVYTDGIPEATDENDELFGNERMLNALNIEPNADPKRLLAYVRNGISEFVKDAEQFDDMTMLCIEYKGAG